MPTKKTPLKLYKYRPFDVNSLRLLTGLEVFYANPRNFNDPLDCNPTVQINTDCDSLERLCYQMLKDAYGKENALKKIKNFQYMSTEYGDYKKDPKVKKYYMKHLICPEIKRLLDTEMASRGVLSMAKDWQNMVMWSHYADQHRGFCIEYDLTDHDCSHIEAVNYQIPTNIKTTELMQWKLHKSAEAEQNIIRIYFFAKSPDWSYEGEWRVIHPSHGASPAPFRISGIYFGLRCDYAVKTLIVKLFANSTSDIAFYDMRMSEDNRLLESQLVDTAEIESTGVQTILPLDFKWFT